VHAPLLGKTKGIISFGQFFVAGAFLLHYRVFDEQDTIDSRLCILTRTLGLFCAVRIRDGKMKSIFWLCNQSIEPATTLLVGNNFDRSHMHHVQGRGHPPAQPMCSDL
jgi:hypothetical protein